MTSEEKSNWPVVLEKGVHGPKEYGFSDLCEYMDREGKPRPICEDGLHVHRCSAEQHTCKTCGSKVVFQDHEGSGLGENYVAEVVTLYCTECHDLDCACSCMVPEHCGVCLNVEPCGCRASAY